MIKIQNHNRTNYIIHSAKGSTWKNHKYIKKLNGIYYYTKEQLAKAGKAISDTTLYEHKETLDLDSNINGIKKSVHKDLGYKKVTVGDVAKKASKPVTKAMKSVTKAIKSVGNVTLYSHETTISYGRGRSSKTLEKKSVTIGSLASNAKKSINNTVKKVGNIVIGGTKKRR